MVLLIIITILALSLAIINICHRWMTQFDKDSTNALIKVITLSSLCASVFTLIIVWKFEILLDFPISGNLFNNLFALSHNLGLLLIIMSLFVLILVQLYLWYPGVNPLFASNILLIIALSVIGAFSANNLFVFLIFFELSSLPIFILLAFSGSARRERIKALYYFVFFTLYGSLSLLLVLISIYALISTNFDSIWLYDEKVLWVLMFLSFAVKLPLSPFHIWLPYAHVEASTITSVILAALLLKLGGYGMIKFMLPMFLINTHLFFRPFILVLCTIGFIYGSFCALRQIDLKRQIAFLSVAHMNFAALGISSLTTAGINGAVYMMVSHGLVSALYFFLIGMLSERYHTRSIMAFSGLWSVMPVYSAFLLFVVLANIGFPGLSGFIPEFLILFGIMSSTPSITYLILFGMVITTVAGLVSILRLLFGGVKASYTNSHFIDLTYIEFIVSLSLAIPVVLLGVYNILA